MKYRNSYMPLLGAVIFMSFLSLNLQAGCAVDSFGEVWCSKFAMGDIKLDRLGVLVCGKGECLQDRLGEFVCSKIEGGGAAMGDTGVVYCFGGCEPATVDYCVRGEE